MTDIVQQLRRAHPDRIWVWEADEAGYQSGWSEKPDPEDPREIEYVHVDLYNALVAERDALREMLEDKT